MNCLMEVLGLALPGNSNFLQCRDEAARTLGQAAKYLMENVKRTLNTHCNKEAIDDAFAFGYGNGRSTIRSAHASHCQRSWIPMI